MLKPGGSESTRPGEVHGFGATGADPCPNKWALRGVLELIRLFSPEKTVAQHILPTLEDRT